MKKTLEDLRNNISDIDLQMLLLFKNRMNYAKEIGQIKKELGLPIEVKAREEEMKEKYLMVLNDENLERYYLEFLNTIISLSKDYQTKC